MESIDSFYRGRKVLITGGLGFIGSNLAHRLVEVGAHVLIVDSLEPNAGGNRANVKDIENKLRVRIVDLRRCEEIGELISGHQVIFSLAGLSSHIDSMSNPLADLGANVHAQIVLLEACRRHVPDARIVFASTRQIYGRPSRFPVAETHPLQPVDVNGINKMAAEAYHSLYHQVYGLQTVSLRLTNTFGPRMRVKDARQTFLGIWVRRVVEDGVFEVWGGQQKRDLSYVEDAVDAFLAAASLSTTQGRIFNIGGSPPVTLAELAESLVAIAGKGRFEIKQYPPELLRIDIGDYFSDDQLFRQLTGWAPKVTLQQGLARTVAYYQKCLSDYV
jgi:UDP-glucose 4-epimerase